MRCKTTLEITFASAAGYIAEMIRERGREDAERSARYIQRELQRDVAYPPEGDVPEVTLGLALAYATAFPRVDL